MPDRQIAELRSLQLTVCIIVQRTERLVAVVPEQPEGDVPEQLEGRLDVALALRVVYEPPGGRRDPRPPMVPTTPVGVEPYLSIEVDDVSSRHPVSQRNGERRHRSWQAVELTHASAQFRDFLGIDLGIQERDQVFGGFHGIEALA